MNATKQMNARSDMRALAWMVGAWVAGAALTLAVGLYLVRALAAA